MYLFLYITIGVLIWISLFTSSHFPHQNIEHAKMSLFNRLRLQQITLYKVWSITDNTEIVQTGNVQSENTFVKPSCKLYKITSLPYNISWSVTKWKCCISSTEAITNLLIYPILLSWFQPKLDTAWQPPCPQDRSC